MTLSPLTLFVVPDNDPIGQESPHLPGPGVLVQGVAADPALVAVVVERVLDNKYKISI